MGRYTNKKILRIYYFIIAGIWTVAVGISITHTYISAEKHIISTALAQSRMAVEKDKIYRVWGAFVGGVYIPADKVKKNPYLAHIVDRDLTTTDGRELTLVNPAYMTRLVYEFSKSRKSSGTRLVSNILLNPVNAPKNWEINALKHILSGQKEYYEFDKSGGNRFRYMVEFVTEAPCLKCHASQGYKNGDIRGGISMETDISDVIQGEKTVKASALSGYFILWLLVIILFTLGYKNLHRILSALEKKEDEMNAVSSQTESILTSAAESIFGVDLNGRVTFTNNALLNTTGYSSQDLVGVSHIILSHTRNEHGMPLEDEECPIMKTIKDGETRNTVERFFRKDKSFFFGDMFVSAIKQNGVITGAVISFHDITDQIERENALHNALTEKDVLLAELHHRVKNNMQIVSGILSLQADSAEGPEAEVLRNAQSRIMSIAIMHECLYQSGNLSEVDMTGYFEKLITHYRNSFNTETKNIRFITDIEHFEMLINVTVTCGILINEIITNSIKHAFNDSENPEILITLRKNNGTAILSIKDNGKGFNPEQPENSDSLGMLLIQSLAEQLYGKLTIESGNGTTITVEFPHHMV